MKTIYLDSEYMCHLENAEGRIEIQTDVFDSIDDNAIPYYRYIPQDKTWVDSRGRTYHGVFIQATDSEAIDRIMQAALLNDMQNALAILGVEA